MQNVDFQLASIVCHRDWQLNDKLQARFVFWAHQHFGLAWQRKLYTSGSQNYFHIQRVVLYLHDNGFKRIELHSSGQIELLRRIHTQDLSLLRIILQVASINIVDLRSGDCQRSMDLNATGDEAFGEIEYQKLYNKLINEQNRSNKPYNRKKRLFRKLWADPILFFKDSKTTSGMFIYKLICSTRPRYAL